MLKEKVIHPVLGDLSKERTETRLGVVYYPSKDSVLSHTIKVPDNDWNTAMELAKSLTPDKFYGTLMLPGASYVAEIIDLDSRQTKLFIDAKVQDPD